MDAAPRREERVERRAHLRRPRVPDDVDLKPVPRESRHAVARQTETAAFADCDWDPSGAFVQRRACVAGQSREDPTRLAWLGCRRAHPLGRHGWAASPNILDVSLHYARSNPGAARRASSPTTDDGAAESARMRACRAARRAPRALRARAPRKCAAVIEW